MTAREIHRFTEKREVVELHDKIRGGAGETKTMRFSEQALYHVLQRNEAYLVRALEQFEYSDPEVKKDANVEESKTGERTRRGFRVRTTP